MTDLNRRPSVLLAFHASNARSFRHDVEIRLEGTAMSHPAAVRTVESSEVGHPVDVLPALAVFGANGSGKTNLLRAMDDMRSHVLHSFRSNQPTGGVPRRPFRLDDRGPTQPTRFAIELVLEGVRLEYGFELDDERFLVEWAFHYPRGRRALVFERSGGSVALGSDLKGKGRAIADILRPNALFLSTAAYAGHPMMVRLFDWFSRNLILANARTRALRQGYTTSVISTEGRRESIIRLLRLVDSGIVDVNRRQLEPIVQERVQRAMRIVMGEEDAPDAADDVPLPDLGVLLVHGPQRVEFDPEDESLGTLVWYGLAGPIIDALADGCVFLADELDASLHPTLTGQLIRVFQSPHTNPNRAQLIFNSHDTTLLGDSSGHELGRDQYWLVDKALDGASTVTRLTDFSPRPDAALGRRYLAGTYGGLPDLSDDDFDQAVLDAIAARG